MPSTLSVSISNYAVFESPYRSLVTLTKQDGDFISNQAGCFWVKLALLLVYAVDTFDELKRVEFRPAFMKKRVVSSRTPRSVYCLLSKDAQFQSGGNLIPRIWLGL